LSEQNSVGILKKSSLPNPDYFVYFLINYNKINTLICSNGCCGRFAPCLYKNIVLAFGQAKQFFKFHYCKIFKNLYWSK